MGNNFKDTDIKNRTYSFFDAMIITKNLDPSKIKIGKKSYKSIIYYNGQVTASDLWYIKINKVKPLYLIINESKGVLWRNQCK